MFIGVTCGLAGAYAGAENTEKSIRRIGIPVLLACLAIFVLFFKVGVLALVCITILSLSGAYSIGYGIPDENDEGSLFGRLWYNVTGDEHQANILTRATVGIFKSLAFISIPIVSGAFLLYSIFCVLVTGNTVLWGAIVDNEGMFTFLDKECLWEEFYRYFGDGFFATLLILFIM